MERWMVLGAAGGAAVVAVQLRNGGCCAPAEAQPTPDSAQRTAPERESQSEAEPEPDPEQLRRQHSTTAAADFVRLWRSGACDAAAHAQLAQLLERCPLSGRMIHGFPDDPGLGRLLSTDEWKRLSWVFGPEALPGFLGKSAREICLAVAERSLDRPTIDRHALLLAGAYYPEVWESKVVAHWERIRTTPFAELEAEAGYSMLEVNLVGRYDHATGESKDDRYVSLQRLLRREGTMPAVRQFMWDEIGLNGQFSGTGRTVDDDGVLGPPEYLCRNLPLAEMHGAVVVDVVPEG